MSKLKNYRFPIILISSIFLGAGLGLYLGEKTSFLSPIGDLFLNLLFTVVVPLVFFAVSSAIANMKGGGKRLGKIMGSFFKYSLLTGVVAALFMLGVLYFINPSQGVEMILEKTEVASTNFGDQLVSTFTVSDFSELLSRGNMLALIVMAFMTGFATQAVGEKGKPVAQFLASASEVVTKIVSYIMYLAPVGLGCYFATLTAEYGPLLMGTYVRSGAIYYISAMVYFFAFFTLYAYMAGRKRGVKSFWSNMLNPSLTSLGTCSSAATIPVNLDSVSRIGVAKDIAETTIPLGANLHKDGTVLGAVLKIVFAFSICGINYKSVGMVLAIIAVSLLVGIVIGAIPGGGMVGEMLILSLFGLPVELLPMISAIAMIVDPPATLLNATGDNTVAMLTAREVDGKNWMVKREEQEMVEEELAA